MDGVIPGCQSAAGCLIPDLMPENQRLMQIRSLITRLAGVVDAGTILRLTEADVDDLILLAAAEDVLRQEKNSDHQQGHHGQGY